MRTANPALNDQTFGGFGYTRTDDVMTMQGTVWKTALLLLAALISATWTWGQFYKANDASAVSGWMIGGAIAGFILALVTVFKPTWASISAPFYAVAEGFFLGGLSAIMEASFPGIVIQSTFLTIGTLFAMLALYQTGIIRATEGFKMGIMAATGGIAIAYLATMVLGFFNIQVPFITGNGWTGIAFSVFVVVIAALNFVLDFDFIDQGAKKRVPKYMEWYGAFALMVTLVWLYVEILRLLSKLRSRN